MRRIYGLLITLALVLPTVTGLIDKRHRLESEVDALLARADSIMLGKSQRPLMVVWPPQVKLKKGEKVQAYAAVKLKNGMIICGPANPLPDSTVRYNALEVAGCDSAKAMLEAVGVRFVWAPIPDSVALSYDSLKYEMAVEFNGAPFATLLAPYPDTSVAWTGGDPGHVYTVKGLARGFASDTVVDGPFGPATTFGFPAPVVRLPIPALGPVRVDTLP